MHCPYCKSQSVYKGGVKQRGQQPFFCVSCQRSFQKRSIKGISLGVFLTLILSLPLLWFAVSKDMTNRSDDGKSASVIVVLGRGPSLNAERTIITAQLYKQKRAPRVFVSGMTDAPEMITLLEQMGVPEEQISGERCSQSTWENGLFTKILLSPLKTQRILLVTDQTHMKRAVLVFRGFGFNVIPYPVRSRISWEHQLRELGGLIAYQATGKLNSAKSDQVQQVETQAQYKIRTWNCSLGSINKDPTHE